MEKTHNEQSYCREYGIHECDDRLSLQYDPESCAYFVSEDRPLIVEKSEISIAYLSEEFLYLLTIDDEEIREDECDEKFREDDTSICDIGDRIFSDRFEVIRTDKIRQKFTETKVKTRTFFEFHDEVLTLTRDARRLFQKLLYLTTDLWKDIHEYKDEYSDKYDIETRDDDIGSSVFPCDLVRSILLSYFAPVVDLVS